MKKKLSLALGVLCSLFILFGAASCSGDSSDGAIYAVLIGNASGTGGVTPMQVYDVPKFTSFTIPLVSTTKEGSLVTAKIVGENFDKPATDLGNFSASCATSSITANANFTKESDSVLYVTLKIPGTAGEYSITVSYGSNSKTGILKAQDFSAYKVGDVLLNDGTIVRYTENPTFTDDQKSKAVGVMYAFNEYEAPAGWLGLHNSTVGTNSGDYMWAKSGATGCNTNFTDIQCTPSQTGIGAASAATFTGDTDGSDNWAYICSLDPQGSADAATNYPAFDYVNKYAETFSLTGAYATGWYMPSIAELSYIYRNKTTLNTVLQALGGTELASVYYWSSSQYSDIAINAWILYFSDGNFGINNKNNGFRVCCVRAFSN